VQAVGIAAAVGALVVGQDHRRDLIQALDAAHQLGASLGVTAHDLHLAIAERAAGEQDPVRERELADVVQQARRVHDPQLILEATGRAGDSARVSGHGRGVSRGALVAQRQRTHHRHQHADLQRGELQRALLQLVASLLRAEQLGQQRVEGAQQRQRQNQRRRPRVDVEHGQRGGQEIGGRDPRQGRDEVASQLHGDWGAGVDADPARRQHEVDQVRGADRADDHQRERRAAARDAILDGRPDHQRPGEHVDVHAEIPDQRQPSSPQPDPVVPDGVDDARRQADRHCGRRSQQRHRQRDAGQAGRQAHPTRACVHAITQDPQCGERRKQPQRSPVRCVGAER
jgi:hypothetical protein